MHDTVLTWGLLGIGLAFAGAGWWLAAQFRAANHKAAERAIAVKVELIEELQALEHRVHALELAKARENGIAEARQPKGPRRP